MKKILFLIVSLLLSTTALNAKSKGYYCMKLIEVDANNIKGDFSTQKDEKGIDYSTYTDSIVKFNFFFHPTHIDFTLENKAKKKMKLVWDEAIYVGINQSSTGVFHTGIKYNDREETQVPTTIIKGSKLSDCIIPKDYVSWSSTFGRWLHTYILQGEESSTNKTITIQLPIEIDGAKIDYTFTFEIKWEDAKVKKSMSSGLEYYTERKQ